MQPLDEGVSHTGDIVADDAMRGGLAGLFGIGFRQAFGILQVEVKQFFDNRCSLFFRRSRVWGSTVALKLISREGWSRTWSTDEKLRLSTR